MSVAANTVSDGLWMVGVAKPCWTVIEVCQCCGLRLLSPLTGTCDTVGLKLRLSRSWRISVVHRRKTDIATMRGGGVNMFLNISLSQEFLLSLLMPGEMLFGGNS